MSGQETGHGHHAITREAVHELFTSGRGEKGPDGRIRIRGLTEDEYFEQLDKAQEHQDRFIGGDTWHDASLDPHGQKHHAMANPYRSGEQNVADIKDYITDELETARAHQDSHGEEMKHLGASAHALEDSYSEAHEFRGDAVFDGDPTAPIESLNVFHPGALYPDPTGTYAMGTHDHYLDKVPVGPGVPEKKDRYDIAHNADGSVPLEHMSDLAGARATAEMLERYEDHRSTAETGHQALDHAVDPFFQTDPAGVGVNKDYWDPSFQHELRHRIQIDQAQEHTAQHPAHSDGHSSDYAWEDPTGGGSQEESFAEQSGDYDPGVEAGAYGHEEEA